MLTTERLSLIPLTQADLPELLKLYHDADMMRYILMDHQYTDEALQARAQNLIDSWQRDGFGYYRVLGRDQGDIIGYVGFRRLAEPVKGFDGYAELGYMIWPRFAGKGYATEAVQACMKVGFSQLGFDSIVATIAPENQASAMVAQRVGMRYMAYDELLHSDIYVADNTQI
jgi:ribosomal-protein-alanine N-acetyltransferase